MEAKLHLYVGGNVEARLDVPRVPPEVNLLGECRALPRHYPLWRDEAFHLVALAAKQSLWRYCPRVRKCGCEDSYGSYCTQDRQ